jgi:hypothetical protein
MAQKTIDLNSKMTRALEVGHKWFMTTIGLREDIRNDEKMRTGIQMLLQQPGTRNLIFLAIIEPSKVAQVLASEKATRSNVLGDVSSFNSRNPQIMRFGGAVTATFDGVTLQASTSGLKEEEDILVSVMQLAEAFDKTPLEICTNISEHGGLFPPEFFEVDSYLYKFIRSESAK